MVEMGDCIYYNTLTMALVFRALFGGMMALELTKYTLDVTEAVHLDGSGFPKYHILLWADAFTRGEGKSHWLLLAFWRAWDDLKEIQRKRKEENCPHCGKNRKEIPEPKPAKEVCCHDWVGK